MLASAAEEVLVESDLRALIARLAARDASRSEATIQADVRQLLLTAPLSLTENQVKDVHLESPVGDRRRIDVEVGCSIIEVKRDLQSGRVLADAIEQLEGYVTARQTTQGGRWVGILTDGSDWICYHLRSDGLREVARITVTASKATHDALVLWLEGVLATARDLKATPSQIQQRLGVGSSAHALDSAGLRALFDANRESPVVATKRRLWARLLQTALGTQFEDSDELFVEHTLLVNTAEVVAHAVLGLDLGSIAPQSLLSGAKFNESGVFGVVEADFFDWVIAVPRGDEFVRELARRIGRFDWREVDHDVLKVLYESVISANIRKKLGEYYTPDWLAERVVKTAVLDPLNARVLDPACGSGTFLFHAVRHYIAAARERGDRPVDIIAGVTRNVIGMDLHPVAVTLARVTYLLAIGTDLLLEQNRGSVRVPVFLGDSFQWLQPNPGLFRDGHLRIPVDDGRELTPSEFSFPAKMLDDARVFDDLVSQLADLASRRKPHAKVPTIAGVLQRLAVSPEMHDTLNATFRTMCRLHDEGRDHIWGYYIRNLARPDWLTRPENRADIVVGNPPWLAYKFMSQPMQVSFLAMNEARGLWHGAKVAPHQDLSALFAVRMMELYLKPEGRFAFVMPSAALDRGQFKGFRSGCFDGDGAELRVHFDPPWDLRRLRPHFFPISASVVFGRRSRVAQALPSNAEVWSGQLPRANASWRAVEGLIKRGSAGQPIGVAGGVPRSAYHKRFRQGASLVPRALFLVDRLPVGPLGQVRNRAEVRSARSPNEKKPWRELDRLTGIIETEFLYPVCLGESVLPYRVVNLQTAVLPIDAHRILVAQDEGEAAGIAAFDGLSEWWERVDETWKSNGSGRLNIVEQLDFHGKLSCQLPLPEQRVVYSKSGMHIAAARLLNHRAVVDHTLYWSSVASTEEAHYLCAILNSRVVTERVRPIMAYGKDERHIDKYVWHLGIPLFSGENQAHRELAELGRRAERDMESIALDNRHFTAHRRAVRLLLDESPIGREIEVAVTALLEEPAALEG